MLSALRLLAVALLAAVAAAAEPAIPDWEGVETIDLARAALPDHGVGALASVLPGAGGGTVTVLDHPGALALDFWPRSPGRYRLAVAAVVGGPHAAFAVRLNGVELGRSASAADAPAAMVVEVVTPRTWAYDNRLELAPLNAGTLAVRAIAYAPMDALPVPAAAWRSGPGCSTAWLLNPVPFARPVLRLRATAACVLRVDGEAMLSIAGGATVARLARGAPLYRIEVASAGAFTLETGDLGGGRLVPELPPAMLPAVDDGAWPRVELGRPPLQATVALPDPVAGFHRGHRFENAGLVTALVHRGHDWIGRNHGERRDPAADDQVCGPAEEFAEPVGFHESAEGEPFLKVGVGEYERPFAGKYFFGWRYPPVRAFAWETTRSGETVAFRQRADGGRGWAYDYEKTVAVDARREELVVAHRLRNTGTRRLTTTHYSHNFLLLDRQPPAAGYDLAFGFAPELPWRPRSLKAGSDPCALAVLGGDPECVPVRGCTTAAGNRVRLTHRASGAAITVSEDHAPFRQALYVAPAGICPESFVRIDLAPGEEMAWTRRYRCSSP